MSVEGGRHADAVVQTQWSMSSACRGVLLGDLHNCGCISFGGGGIVVTFGVLDAGDRGGGGGGRGADSGARSGDGVACGVLGAGARCGGGVARGSLQDSVTSS